MKNKKYMTALSSLLLTFALTGCSGSEETAEPEQPSEHTPASSDSAHSGHMNHSSSGEVPDDLKEAENPAFPVGSQVILNTDHMEGMNGAEATIAGAYETTAYAVSYTSMADGKRVENHKWVIQEEIETESDAPLEPGTEVVIDADHMEGMDGATAVIDSAEETVVYMVDYTPANGGDKVTNHKWVTESELSAN